MKIKCISNNSNVLPKDLSPYETRKESNENRINDSLKVGKEYVVYGIYISDGYLWYFICDESYFYFPRSHPSMYFEVSDSRMSRFWIFGLEEDEYKERMVPILSFPEWVNDRYFYGELVEDGPNDPNTEIFDKYKELMDFEFPDAAITEIAQVGDSEWLICQDCIDAWLSPGDRDALVRCPLCEKVFNNPRYKIG